MRCLTLAGLIVLAASAAWGRTPDCTLGLIVTPNNGVPAIVTPGGQFDVVLTEKAEIKLAGPHEAPALEVQWMELPGGRMRARCRAGMQTAPGTYAVEAAAGATVDRNERAVYVLSAFPDYYVVAHVTDTHVGSNRHPRPAGDIMRDAIAAINATDAAFVLVSGDLTDNGTPEQFREFMAILDTCAKPTFVCVGNHDREGLTYEQMFGPLTYCFFFGADGYLVFDTKDFVTADDLRQQNADLEIYRRAIKQCRWAVGVTHRYEPAQSMRSQLILFADNPLDHLMYGHEHRVKESTLQVVPWQTTPTTMTPATVDGFMRLYDVSSKELRPREPQRVASVEPPAPEPAPADGDAEQAASDDEKSSGNQKPSNKE